MYLSKLIRILLAIFITAGILLLLDLENRKTDVKNQIPDIAIFKITSRKVIDETENGVISALGERGFTDGKTCMMKRFSAEGDMAVANTIAQNIVSSRFDMVITISTPSLQVMANANKKGDILHVFCAVTDPYNSGVGISGTAPDEHPPHLVGIGTFQPVEKTFEIMRQMKPDLKKVGTVWCTSETCSEACVKLARKKCAELGIELVEMGIENSTQILESAMAVTMSGVEALWVGGDNTVENGIDQLINAASRAKIPLITNNPYNTYGNILFGFGAEYFEVGKLAGNMAADVLEGKSTTEIGVEDIVPNKLVTNPDALNNIKDKWNIDAANL
jgi:putative ABC transport system substrate-binding protein